MKLVNWVSGHKLATGSLGILLVAMGVISEAMGRSALIVCLGGLFLFLMTVLVSKKMPRLVFRAKIILGIILVLAIVAGWGVITFGRYVWGYFRMPRGREVRRAEQ